MDRSAAVDENRRVEQSEAVGGGDSSAHEVVLKRV